MKRRALLLGVLAAGCGSGAGGSEFVTRETEPTLTLDALILASRSASGLRVPLRLAQRMDDLLREVRAAYPHLAGSHVPRDNDPHTLHVALALDAPWRAVWERGEWRTGERAIDGVLGPLNVVQVRPVSVDENRAIYAITFAQWVRARAVAFTLHDKSPWIQSVSLIPHDGGSESDDLLYFEDDSGEPSFTSGSTLYLRREGIWREVGL